MSFNKENQPDSMLDAALREIRGNSGDSAAMKEAAARVWNSLSAASASGPRVVDHIRGCADYQALFAEYRSGSLSSARAALLSDHLHECVHCRRAFHGQDQPFAVPAAVPGGAAAAPEVEDPRVVTLPSPAEPPPSRTRRPVPWWAAAAAMAIAGLVGVGAYLRFAPSPAAARATIVSIEGKLYRLGPAGTEVKAGEILDGGTEVRTAQNSGAMLRLSDGSLVEMGEQSGLVVSATGRDLTVRLAGGAVLIQAAKDRSRHLYVVTRDARVAVTGTVFSVNSGIKGSRVSVVEGEVRVTPYGAAVKVLHPGDQVTTSPKVGVIPVEEEIAWSRNYSRHLALLREFAALGRRIDSEVRMPGLRYSSTLLPRLPADTVIVASLPNLGQALSQAHDIFRQRVQESPVLKEWWDGVESKHSGAGLDEVIAKVREVSEYLGGEIVLAVSMDSEGRLSRPVLMAEVKRPGLEQLAASGLKVSGLAMTVRSGVAVVSPGQDSLARAAAALESGGGFASTPLYKQLNDSYRDGAGFLFSADLNRIAGSRNAPHDTAARTLLPLDRLSSVVVEQKEASGGGSALRASVVFSGERSGIASWLGSPAAMGVLDFISPDANFATSFVIRNPAQILEELLAAAAARDANFSARLAEAEARLGISIRNDLAGPLGTQIAVAVDGPLFPSFSWKVIAEVYDPSRFQWAVQKVVESFNREMAGNDVQPVTLSQTAANGRVYYTLSTKHPKTGATLEAHYTFADGYLVAAATQALVDSSLQQRASGFSLARSAGFLALVPSDSYTGFSGMIYSNMGGALAAVLESLSPERRQIAGEMKPTLIALYAGQDRVTVSTSGGLLGLTLNQLLAMEGPAGLFRKGTSQARSAYPK